MVLLLHNASSVYFLLSGWKKSCRDFEEVEGRYQMMLKQQQQQQEATALLQTDSMPDKVRQFSEQWKDFCCKQKPGTQQDQQKPGNLRLWSLRCSAYC